MSQVLTHKLPLLVEWTKDGAMSCQLTGTWGRRHEDDVEFCCWPQFDPAPEWTADDNHVGVRV